MPKTLTVNFRSPYKARIKRGGATRERDVSAELPVASKVADTGDIAMRFIYEWRGHCDGWFRSCGNENCESNEHGLLLSRSARINDLPIHEEEPKFHWPQGRRQDDLSGVSHKVGAR